ncbi:MAG: NusG domain II-containing protein [Saccharofermentanales bacterium]
MQNNTGLKNQLFNKMRWGDFLIIIVVVILSFSLWSRILFAGTSRGGSAEVVAGGEILLRYDLGSGKQTFVNEDILNLVEEFTAGTDESGNPLISMAQNGIHFKLLIQDGKVRFFVSDCPNQVCVNTGFISISGQLSACVPAGVLVRVTGLQSEDDPDIIIG